MRSLQHAKTKKGPNRKINKHNCAKKTNVANAKKLNYRNDIRIENLESINEAFRIHKVRGERNSWKLIPKDSCEVYKARRRRQSVTKQPQDGYMSYSEDNSYCTQESRATVPKVTKKRAKKVKKGKTEKKTRNRRRYRRLDLASKMQGL